MTLQNDLDEVREAHLRAWLSGIDQITPLEIRAVVRAAIDSRDKILERAYEVLQKGASESRSIRHDNVMFEIEQLMKATRKS